MASGPGGTLDIAAHEIHPNKRLHEISVARGNDMGGHYFNQKCLEVFEEMFGKECLEYWKTTYCNDFLDMERKIEEMKRKVSTEDYDIRFKIYRSLSNIYKDISGGKGFEHFECDFSRYVESSTKKKGYLMLKNKFFRDVVKQVAVTIKNYLTEIITDIPSLETIFMVGGLAKSTFVHQYIETQFPQCRVIVPEDPGVAMLRGAVLLGDRPYTIASRVARYTYGFLVRQRFVKGSHRREYKVIDDGMVLSTHVFEKLIEKGQVLKYGQIIRAAAFMPAKRPKTKHISLCTELYQSTQPSPMYVTDDGCRKLGRITVPPPEGGWPNYCRVDQQIIVGEAEFRLVVSDEIGREEATSIDFLLP